MRKAAGCRDEGGLISGETGSPSIECACSGATASSPWRSTIRRRAGRSSAIPSISAIETAATASHAPRDRRGGPGPGGTSSSSRAARTGRSPSTSRPQYQSSSRCARSATRPSRTRSPSSARNVLDSPISSAPRTRSRISPAPSTFAARPSPKLFFAIDAPRPTPRLSGAMCGLVGAASWSAPIDPSEVRRAIAALRHRGPDGDGGGVDSARRAVGLGHTRLAIMDPEDGAQPLASEDGSIHSVVNGGAVRHERSAAISSAAGIVPDRRPTARRVHLYEEEGSRAPAACAASSRSSSGTLENASFSRRATASGSSRSCYAHARGRRLPRVEAKALFAAGRAGVGHGSVFQARACSTRSPIGRCSRAFPACRPAAPGRTRRRASGSRGTGISTARVRTRRSARMPRTGSRELAARFEEPSRSPSRRRADRFQLSGGIDSSAPSSASPRAARGHVLHDRASRRRLRRAPDRARDRGASDVPHPIPVAAAPRRHLRRRGRDTAKGSRSTGTSRRSSSSAARSARAASRSSSPAKAADEVLAGYPHFRRDQLTRSAPTGARSRDSRAGEHGLGGRHDAGGGVAPAGRARRVPRLRPELARGQRDARPSRAALSSPTSWTRSLARSGATSSTRSTSTASSRSPAHRPVGVSAGRSSRSRDTSCERSATAWRWRTASKGASLTSIIDCSNSYAPSRWGSRSATLEKYALREAMARVLTPTRAAPARSTRSWRRRSARGSAPTRGSRRSSRTRSGAPRSPYPRFLQAVAAVAGLSLLMLPAAPTPARIVLPRPFPGPCPRTSTRLPKRQRVGAYRRSVALSLEESTLSAEVEARVSKVLADVGETVKEGQPLILLDRNANCNLRWTVSKASCIRCARSWGSGQRIPRRRARQLASVQRAEADRFDAERKYSRARRCSKTT